MQCLLFDCDGTLVDSERLCNVALAAKFKEYGVELDADELVKRFRGWKLAAILELLQSEWQLKLRDDFVVGYRVMVSDLFESELKPVEHVEYALRHLHQPKAVVSSGPRHKIEQALRVCGLSGYFGSNIYSAYEVNIWKPDPGLYLHAAKSMGFPAEQCAVIEDGAIGIEAGYRAGMKTFFYNKFNDICEFESVISFHSMRDLPQLV